MKALALICTLDQRTTINRLEAISEWTVREPTASPLPTDEWDLIFWSMCDPKKDLPLLPNMLQQVTNFGKLYLGGLQLLDSIAKECFNNSDEIDTIDIFQKLIHELIEIKPILIQTPTESLFLISKNNLDINVPEMFDQDLERVDQEISDQLPEPSDLDDDKDLDDPVDEDDDDESQYPEFPDQPVDLPLKFGGLTNIQGTSCFIDSVLFVALLPNNDYFRKMLQKNISSASSCDFFKDDPQKGIEYLQGFQSELRKLAAIISGNLVPDITCYPIIQQMRKCNLTADTLLSEGQQDDSEFLRVLMEMFALEPTTVIFERSVSNDKKQWTLSSRKQEKKPILEVTPPNNASEPIDLVSWYQRIVISNFGGSPQNEWPRGADDQIYQYLREKETIIDSEALIFHVARRQVKGWGQRGPIYVKNTTAVKFEEYIKSSDRKFALQAVTIHTGSAYGGHYTAYFKYRDQWFYYDDTARQKIVASNWLEVVADAATNGSLYMYYPI